jgi:AraC-like DNA-binding protein
VTRTWRQRIVDIHDVELDAFAFTDEIEPSRPSVWHAHGSHQLLYAASGTLGFEVRSPEAGGTQWLLPPQRAAWIPANVEHRVRAVATVALCTVYFRPAFCEPSSAGASVFGASPLARSMILESVRWGPELRALPAVGAKFFAALAALAGEWRRDPMPYCLPTASTPELGRAMQFALDHLAASPSIEGAARAAGLSPRTLERRFASEASTSWRKFVHSARMIRALELLAVPGKRVTDVAVELGFASFGAFSTAFQKFTGETPSAHRKRAAT